MPEEFAELMADMKALTRAATTSEAEETLPVAENEFQTRPNAVSYGIIHFEFEVSSLDGDNLKQERAFEGSMDLYSKEKHGDGWVPLIEEVLTRHCDSCWMLNYHEKEAGTNLFRWEWTFQVEG